MKNRLKNNIFTIVVILGFISNLAISIDSTKGYLPVEFYPGESFTWEIDDINEGTNMWWNSSDWSLTAIWQAVVNDEISFDITDFIEKDSKKYLVGNLDIGNLSISTDDYNNGFNLALSADPWFGGLISLEQDWSVIATQSPFTGENASVQLNYKTTILGLEINTAKITYSDAFQTSELLYEMTTGILISANTTAGLFSIEMHLTSSSIPLPTVTAGLPQPGLICFLFSVTFLALYSNIKKKRS